MSEILERGGHESAGPEESAHPRRFRWTRNRIIWLLIVLSLLPGVVIALFRDEWLALPPGVRGAVYLTCVILIVAACSLILTGGAKQSDDS